MSNEDSVFGDILVELPLTSGWEFGMESTIGELESENENENENRSKKRDRALVSDDLPENKREDTKKQSRRRRTFYFGGWSTSQQQPETTTEAERSRERGKKDVAKGAKLLVDRIDRRIKISKSADMESKILAYKTIAMKASHLSPEFHDSLEQVEKQWTPGHDLQKLKQHIKKIEVDFKENRLTENEANQTLLEIEKKLKQLDQQVEDLKKTRDTDATFAKNTLCSSLPRVIPGDQNHGSLSTREKLDSRVTYLISQLYDKANSKVEYKEFPGLEEALKNTAWGRTPDYLEPIANRIEMARGKATEVAHSAIQVPVCAAIKEMEDSAVEDLEWDTLKKWGATLNRAKELGFHVAFADNLLKKNLLAFAYSTTMGGD